MSDLRRRALVVFTLGPLTLFLIYLGGWFYFLPFAALLAIALFEFTKLAERSGWRTPFLLLFPFVFAQWILPEPVLNMLLPELSISVEFLALALLIGLLAILGYVLWLYEKRPESNAPGSWMANVTALVLMGWLGSHFFRLRGLEIENAAAWTALAMLGTWIADSGAYVFGKSFGRHKLSPKLSPNKTIEGYLGGAIVGTIFTVVIAFFLDLFFLDLNIIQALALGLLVSIVSPAGDLGVSLLKRSVDVKDSGNLLPGHGGALDRIDSLVWSMALAYYLLLFTI